MGFPIALGTKSVASRPIPAAHPLEEFDHQNGGLLFPSPPSSPCMVVATSADQELLALITLYYYNMCRRDDGSFAYCVAEVHIQISLLGNSTSLSGREVLHRISLPGNLKCSRDECAFKQSVSIKPMATFSADRRYLTCLIPHPLSSTFTESSSSVVVFQLRRPKGVNAKTSLKSGDGPPLPAYVVPSLLERPIIPVATNPAILQSSSDDGEDLPLVNATSLCDVDTSVGPLVSGLLLVGCLDGSIQVASYRPAVCCGVLHPAMSDNHQNAYAVMELDHWTEWRDRNERTLVGRLAVVWTNGRVMAFRSHFAETDDSDRHDLNNRSADRQVSSSIRSSSSKDIQEASDFSFGVIPTHEFPSSGGGDEEEGWDSAISAIVSARWIAGSYLAVLEAPDTQCTVHVVGLYDFGKCAPISTLIVSREQLDESVQGVFRIPSDPMERVDVEYGSDEDDFIHRRILLEYDAFTDCLAITSFLVENEQVTRKHSFVCLWSWRSNVLGLMTPLSRGPTFDSVESGTLHFAIDHVKRRKIALVGAGAVSSSHFQMHAFKETFDFAVLSPPYEASSQRCKLRETNSLLLSAESVSFPNCTKISPALEHFEIEWMDAAIPKQYLSSYGAPTVAAVGKELGRSIAVASTRGFCVLDRTTGSDRHGSLAKDDEANTNVSHTASSHDNMLTTLVHRGGKGPPRWRLFANESHERNFRVVAMTWWEGFPMHESDAGAGHAFSDDLLVTIIEVLEMHDHCKGYYLSCWSGRDVELPSQLLQSGMSTNGGGRGTRWGIPLPPDFLPGCIDLLACPFFEGGSRLAAVLLADSTYTTKYAVYQLQVGTFDPHGKGSSYVSVQCRCIAKGNAGSPSELFLASASFSTPSRENGEDISDDFAVLGVLRKYGGGLDALSVCCSSIVSVGQIIESADHGDDEPRSAEISRYWLADVVQLDQRSFFVWTFQLACGRLLSWSIPFLESMDMLNLSSKIARLVQQSTAFSMVHPKSSILGFVCPSGTISNWMQQSSMGAQRDFLCGSVPRSSSGCVLGVSQLIKNICTPQLAAAIDQQFRSNVVNHVVVRPNDFKLYPPAFLPAFYFLAIEADCVSITSCDRADGFERHLQRKMTSRALQDMSVVSMQLIILRLVEKLAVISRTNETDTRKYTQLRGILITAVAGIRNQTTALQFASFFLHMGRQVEPSCLPHLFPLPETLEDLISISVACGSVPSAVSAVPLLSDQKSSLSLCASLFHCCLNQFDSSFRSGSCFNFAICPQELEATGGLFRYALKGQRRRSEILHVSDHDELLDNDELAPTNRYSLMCGLSTFFGARKKPSLPATVPREDFPLLVHGITDDRINKLKEFGVDNIRRLSLWKDLYPSNQCLGNVPAIAARYVLATLFGGPAYETRIGWKKVSALAHLLMQDVPQSEYSSASLALMLQRTKVNRWVALAPVDIRRGGMTSVLAYCLEQCRLDAEVAGCVLDFLLVLLLACDVRHLGSDRPGLLLAAVVSAHVAQRIPDVLDPPSNSMDELSAAYYQLFSMSFVSNLNDSNLVIV